MMLDTGIDFSNKEALDREHKRQENIRKQIVKEAIKEHKILMGDLKREKK